MDCFDYFAFSIAKLKMELLINNTYNLKFKPEPKINEDGVSGDWFAVHNIDGLELEVCFNEKTAYKWRTDQIDWERIEKIVSTFILHKDIILKKANEALLALNKALGYWTDEQMTNGFYDFISLGIVQDPCVQFELFFKLIGNTMEHYFIDGPTANWYVSFHGKSLIGMRREVL